MATTKPRVSVTLQPEHYRLLSELARLQGRSRSDLLRELFETVAPVLERVGVTLQRFQQAQANAQAEARAVPHQFRQSIERHEATLSAIVGQELDQMDLWAGEALERAARHREGGEAGQRAERARPPHGVATPVPVTTGVRSPKKRGKRP